MVADGQGRRTAARSYLADLGGDRQQKTLQDPAEPERDTERQRNHLDAVELALTAADLDARGRDYAGALRWLEAAERLNLVLPYEYARKRERWTVQGEAAEREPR